jgi:serine/threonine protein kinase
VVWADDKIKLIDLGASAKIETGFAGAKCSSAYVPPELVYNISECNQAAAAAAAAAVAAVVVAGMCISVNREESGVEEYLSNSRVGDNENEDMGGDNNDVDNHECRDSNMLDEVGILKEDNTAVDVTAVEDDDSDDDYDDVDERDGVAVVGRTVLSDSKRYVDGVGLPSCSLSRSHSHSQSQSQRGMSMKAARSLSSTLQPPPRKYAIKELVLNTFGRPLQSNVTYKFVPAHPSLDVWALGMVFFHLCSGETFFHSDEADNIDDESLSDLYHFTDEFKAKRLMRVKDRNAKNFISRLLHKDWEKRLTLEKAKEHPFITGQLPTRMPDEKAEFDVFLSYRVSSDAAHVQAMYTSLVGKGLRVWWDKQCLRPGESWEEGFCRGEW